MGYQERKPMAERFWGKVDKRGPDECWFWQGAKRPDGMGYGWFRMSGSKKNKPIKYAYAHRMAFFFANGYWPNVTMHSCDEPLCVNPAHLRDGTVQENNRDCKEKGRVASGERNGVYSPGVIEEYFQGERNPAAKLTEQKVIEIRAAVAAGMRLKDVAIQYDISETTVSLIANRKRWAHVA